MTELADMFTEQSNIGIKYCFSGSAQLLAQAELSEQGDLLVLGAKSYYDAADEEGLLLQGRNLAYHVPVLVVSADNPLRIRNLEDLERTGARVVLGDPELNAAGKAAKKILMQSGLELDGQIIGYCVTVNELGTQIALGLADASISMQDQIVGDMELLGLAIPEELNQKMLVPAGILGVTEHPLDSERFLEFLDSKEAHVVWEKYGFPAFQGESR
jgi:molybdate transport system substrate-binding protein